MAKKSEITVRDKIARAVARVMSAYVLVADFPDYGGDNEDYDANDPRPVLCASPAAFAKAFPLVIKIMGKDRTFNENFRPDPDTVLHALRDEDPLCQSYERLEKWLASAGPQQLRQLMVLMAQRGGALN